MRHGFHDERRLIQLLDVRQAHEDLAHAIQVRDVGQEAKDAVVAGGVVDLQRVLQHDAVGDDREAEAAHDLQR